MSERGERRLGGPTATFLVVASMIGTGVFTTSGLLLADLRSVPAVLLAWALGGLLAMAGALSYAELVAALPQNGGEYHLLSVAYHPAVGFVSGVVSFVVGFAAPIAASALAFGEYAHRLWPAVPEVPAAAALVVGMSALHAARVTVGGWAQNTLTGFKVLLIVGLIGLGLAHIDPARLLVGERPLLALAGSPAMAVSLIWVGFSYSGWNAATYVAGEVRDPARTLPFALIAGTLSTTLLYLGVNVVFLGAAPMSDLAGEVAIGHVAATALFGERAGRALSAVIALGLVSTVGALAMTGTRVLVAMGQDHGPLALLARRATGGGPWVAVTLQAVTALAMVLTASFGSLLAYVGFTLSIFAAATVLGVVVLRVRRPDLPRPYRVWGYPVTPLAFVLLMGWVVVRSIAEEPLVALAGGGTILVGATLFAVLRGTSR